MAARRPPFSMAIQFIVGFIIPTAILLTLSSESRLGPLWAMTLALIPPVALELYSFISGRKASWLSLFAIISILLIGLISLLGLSEEWLGVRRAIIYVVGALFIAWVLRFKRNWVDIGLGKIIDVAAVRKAAATRKATKAVDRHITTVGYTFVIFLLVIAVWSYILTLIVINGPTGSSQFNTEYAELRLLSIPYVTLPLFVGLIGLMIYFLSRLERLTGIELDQLVKKKK